MATVVAVPVVVALLVLIRVFGPDPADDGPAQVSAAPTSRDDSPVEVDTPPITPEADAACPALMSQLPLEVAGETSRRVDSDSPYAYAWGDPAQVLICGVDQPTYPPDATLVTVNGISWFVDTADPEVNVWTTVDRAVAVRLDIPSSTDGAVATALGPIIAGTLPPR